MTFMRLSHVVGERTAAAHAFWDDHLASVARKEPDRCIVYICVQRTLRAANQEGYAFAPRAFREEGLRAVILAAFRNTGWRHLQHCPQAGIRDETSHRACQFGSQQSQAEPLRKWQDAG